MQVRMIKTCHGLEKKIFIDGALMPAGTQENVELIDWYVPMPEPPQKFLDQMNRMLRRIQQFISQHPTA